MLFLETIDNYVKLTYNILENAVYSMHILCVHAYALGCSV